MNIEQFIKQYQDYMAPTLDVYEQAIYLYCYRHSRLIGIDEVVIGFKSARKKMAFGIGEKGKPPSEGTCYEKLKSLQSKGYLKILGTERAGTRLAVFLPNEIPNLIHEEIAQPLPDLEDLDFFNNENLRTTLLEREDHKCFYCLRVINKKEYVIEHVVSRPHGQNNYRNLVAACRQCNNKKGSVHADQFIRSLYRQGLLNESETADRISALAALKNGDIKPDISKVKL